MRRRQFLKWSFGSVALWGTYWTLTRNRLTVSNESGQTAHELSVIVGGEAFHFGELANGAVVSAHFRIGHEETFEVSCRLADGTKIHEYEGYVVWEEDLFGVAAVLIIQPGGALHFST